MHFNRGTKYLEKGNYKKALQFFKKEPLEFKELFLNMGSAYKHLGDLTSAFKCYSRAAAHDVPFFNGKTGAYTLALNNMGLIAYAIGDDATALNLYNAALVLDPLYYDAIWNYSNALLRSTNCSSVSGWKMYEYRFKRSSGAVRIDNTIPTWDGISTGTRIVVLTEQGLGDKIMFGRYLQYLTDYFAEVCVQCHPSLDCLYSDYTIVRSSSGFSVSIPICSLAGIFGLKSENWLDGKFKAHEFDSGFNIGVCWSGSSSHVNNRNRSCSSSYFSDLSDFGSLYSVTPDALPAAKVVALKPKSWAETASYLLGLDLVVTVDTSIVHLAGTLGVPCIMIQPLAETDFRWGDGSKIWYQSVDVVANPGSWDIAFANVRKLIEEKYVQRS